MQPAMSLPTDQKLQKLSRRLQQTIDLTIEKVVAHNEDPKKYPLPAKAKSLERVFHNLFEELPKKHRKAVIEAANKTLKASGTERNRIYGELAAVNLRSAVSLVDQVKTVPVPASLQFTPAEQKELMTKMKQLVPKPKRKPTVARAAVDAVELNFTVQTLTCVRPTDLIKDEVSIAPFVIDNLGTSLEATSFFVGKFKKGDSAAVSNGTLQVSLNNGEFPKTFVGGFLLIEKDLLRASGLVLALSAFLYGACAALVTTALFLIPGAPATAPLIVALGIAGIFSGIVASVIRGMSDDLASSFDVLTLDGPVASETVFDRTIDTSIGDYKGRYKAAVEWIAK
jgi:hypothetical protein